jgi:hypothetical protein
MKSIKELYIVYKTICLVNNKIYVGVHKTFDLFNDCYYGSGKYLLSSIDKYGKVNFEREVLHIYHSKDVAYKREKYIVNKEFLEREDTMNLKIGGYGGWSLFRGTEGRLKRDKTIIERYGSLTDNIHSIEGRKRAREVKILKYGNSFGPINTPEAIAKQLATKKKRGVTINHLFHPEVQMKALHTKKLKYGNGLRSSNPESTKEKKDSTMIEKYGSKVGRMHSKESRKKAGESISKSCSHSREIKSRKQFPEYSIKCTIINTNEIIYDGDIYGASKVIGMGNRLDGRSRVIKSIKEGKELRGRWSKHYVIRKEESSTTSPLWTYTQVSGSGIQPTEVEDIV